MKEGNPSRYFLARDGWDSPENHSDSNNWDTGLRAGKQLQRCHLKSRAKKVTEACSLVFVEDVLSSYLTEKASL
jgi:hypothetical protein